MSERIDSRAAGLLVTIVVVALAAGGTVQAASETFVTARGRSFTLTYDKSLWSISAYKRSGIEVSCTAGECGGAEATCDFRTGTLKKDAKWPGDMDAEFRLHFRGQYGDPDIDGTVTAPQAPFEMPLGMAYAQSIRLSTSKPGAGNDGNWSAMRYSVLQKFEFALITCGLPAGSLDTAKPAFDSLVRGLKLIGD